MLKKLLVAAALCAGPVSPVFAQADLICDQDGLQALEAEIAQIEDLQRKSQAEQALAEARAALAANDIDNCKLHMGEVTTAAKPQSDPL
ncbi:putative SIGNAL PEPTIDE protein (plasmid) [Sinorhizobium sojae CCBAU 05684]|uniref:Putative SIGNAL PEPTIDE protein n=1 Tax=Sinorhizobium sojae CCBAU 05684 TaxID=716928 RepID=A0A249PNX0_9HYPH|nr:hypothetical protein [Sinorhizobium sojae]ASY66999.1 putative SIGNAL PEPTIDE protein [Sinorhizobium sojae CCBAU 05684]